jgi:hypothetical protein
MINIIFDKYRLIIEDSTNTGYARILYLKNLILVANDNITELTILDNNGKLLYTFNSTNSTYTNFTYLGDLVGYALSIGSETNFNQFIRQDTLALVDYHYIYVLDSDEKSYVYYNDGFNVIPDVGGTSNTAGDWMSIEDGIVGFSGGLVTEEKTLTTEVSTGTTTKYTSRTFGADAIDTQEYSITTDELTVNSSECTFSATGTDITVNKYVSGEMTGSNSIVITRNNIVLNVTDDANENGISVDARNTSISAYPNTRNDYPTGDPVNLLTTDADGKIQSFNTGITADMLILGILLRFANGILVEYIP